MNSLNQSRAHFYEMDSMDFETFTKHKHSPISNGRLLVLGSPRFGKFRVVIGPHWYVSLLGFALLTLIGLGTLIQFWQSLSLVLRTLYISVLGFTLLMYTVMFLSDPGIIPQKLNGAAIEDVESTVKYSCTKCMALRSQKAYHCEDCDVCIDGWDHHCVWVGKCIGRENLMVFYVFVATIPIFFTFVMFMTCFISVDIQRQSRVN